MTKTAGLSSVPWKAKLSFVVMGLGQLCYGQIVKGLLYLLSLAGLIVYFVARGVEDIISICMELSPSIPSQRFSCWVPRVKMPMMSSSRSSCSSSPSRCTYPM